jgi:hypothetical protein
MWRLDRLISQHLFAQISFFYPLFFSLRFSPLIFMGGHTPFFLRDFFYQLLSPRMLWTNFVKRFTDMLLFCLFSRYRYIYI